MELRPYQVNAHKAITDAIQSGVSKQLLQAATGTGKTILFANLPEQLKATHPGKMLVLAHREELVDQAITKIKKANPSLRVDKEMAEHRADPEEADVIVASVASLGRAGTKRILEYDWTKFDKFVVDEAHHAVASTYRNIFEAARLFEPGNKRLLLGVTATPQRADGKALATLFDKLVYSYSIREAIEDGWLVSVRGFKVSTGVSLDDVKATKEDYDQVQLANTVNTPYRNLTILKAWMERGENRPTLGFTVDIQHAKDLASLFQKHGIKAEALWGDDPDRAKKLAMHREGHTKVLFNCGVLIEGYDDWRISCIILGAPTKSSVKFTQEVGRGTRLEEEPDGRVLNLHEKKASFSYVTTSFSEHPYPFKTDCIILDVVDSTTRHSLLTIPTLMGLPSTLDLKGHCMVESVKKIEAMQEKFPHIDFTKLTNIDDLHLYIGSVNLFEIKLLPEVVMNSELTWFPSPTGGYTINLPAYTTGKKTKYGTLEKFYDKLSITQNIFERWSISGTIRGVKAKGERPTLAEAFSAADGIVKGYYSDSIKILSRSEPWHADPATPAQIKLLKKLFKEKAIPTTLTKGAASLLISQHKVGS